MNHRIPRPRASNARQKALHTILFLALFIGGAANGAEDKAIAFNLPAQPLSTALDHIANTTRTKLIYADASVQGLTAPRLKGRYTVHQALDKVLNNQGLRYEVVDNTLITVKPTKSTETTSLPKVTVSGTAAGAYDSNDPFDKNYAVPNSFAATKTDTPIIETPMSIQVVPKAVMDDQQAFTLQEALKNVSGVRFFDNSGGESDNFFIRGFELNRNLFRNGLLLEVGTFETANLDRVEVLKGPAAMLYGRSQPGGLINLVTKKPLADSYYSLQQQFGSFDLYRTTADATGPITEDKSLLYRFNLAYQSNNSFRDFVFLDRIFVAPSLTWLITDDTDWTVDFEYLNNKFLLDPGNVAIGDRPAPLPRSRYLSDPFITNNENERKTVQSILTHRFNDDWKLTNRFIASSTDYFQRVIGTGPGLRPDNRTLNRVYFNFQPQYRNGYGTNLDLTGHFATGPLDHKTLVGFDFYQFDQKTGNGGSGGQRYLPLPGALNDALPIDIFNPVYGQIPLSAVTSLPKNFFFEFEQTWYGLYFQDEITLWDKLHILGGGRQDWTASTSGFSTVSSVAARAAFNNNWQRVQHFSPRVGVSYNPWPWLSLYGNYMEAFGSNNGLTRGKPFSPETSESYEVGFKTELFDKRLTSTVAFYHLTKQNVLTPDPFDRMFSIPIGEARSRGIEVDIAGQVTDGLSLIATYALTDTEITKDNRGNQGKRLLNAPLHSGSFWTKYEFQSAPLQGLSLGAGVYLASQRQGDTANTFQLPGYGRVDVFAAYRYNFGPTRLTAQVNINNLTDKNYFSSSVDRAGVLFGAPRTVLGSIRLEY